MEELNKCPFCGGNAEVTGRKKIKVECQQCGAESPPFDFRSQAIAFWNNRAIVRCGECKFYHPEEKWCDKYSHFEDDGATTFEENQYCSLGEKKENGE